MYTVDVDFEVYKRLTNLRDTEEVTYNDVIRQLLGLSSAKTEPQKTKDVSTVGDWVVKGVRFPAGTEFRATYKGTLFQARVEAGALLLGVNRFTSPSAAAVSITKSPVNGWRFWECKLPGKATWQLIESLRR